MGHITFVHGIMNQPSPDRLLAIWKRDIADGGDGVDLDVYGITSSMVYWADVMYAAATDARGAGQESIEYEGIEPGALTEIDESYIEEADGAEREFLESMIENYDLDHPDEPQKAEAGAPMRRCRRLRAPRPGSLRHRPWRRSRSRGSSNGP